MSARPSGRANDQLRPVSLEPGFSLHAEGSCLVRFGNTHVLCTASVEDRVPPFMRGQGRGWVTAEYGMLPRSTHTRGDREAARGKQSGRTQEIQRLIGRALRSVVDMQAMGERQIKIDCDVIQADGGTRTAAITGAYVALYQAFTLMQNRRMIKEMPLSSEVVAVSCGVFKDQPILDLDYAEDSNAPGRLQLCHDRPGRDHRNPSDGRGRAALEGTVQRPDDPGGEGLQRVGAAAAPRDHGHVGPGNLK